MGLPCKLAPGFPPASPHVPFFPLLISLCTFFAIIKLSRENDHVLGESFSTPGWAPGPLREPGKAS